MALLAVVLLAVVTVVVTVVMTVALPLWLRLWWEVGVAQLVPVAMVAVVAVVELVVAVSKVRKTGKETTTRTIASRMAPAALLLVEASTAAMVALLRLRLRLQWLVLALALLLVVRAEVVPPAREMALGRAGASACVAGGRGCGVCVCLLVAPTCVVWLCGVCAGVRPCSSTKAAALSRWRCWKGVPWCTRRRGMRGGRCSWTAGAPCTPTRGSTSGM